MTGVSAVLAELIANAYDADAEQVQITLPFGEYLASRRQGQIEDRGFEIIVDDNGSGMTADEVNEYYLNVGYNRRTGRSEETPKHKRRVMGRKGIGKLAPFGICQEVEVISAGGPQTTEGYQVANLVLDLPNILNEQFDENGNLLPYHPKLGPADGTYAGAPGTKLILRRFDRRRVPTGEDINRQLAARFGLSRPDWKVNLVDSDGDGEPVEVGTLDIDLMEDTVINVSDRPVQTPEGQELAVSGWVAYAKDPYRDEVMAGVRFFARGKLVAQTRDFDIKSGFTGEFKMRSYLTGAIHAEWLDGEEDLIRTDRQDIIWNSDSGNALRDWGHELLRELARRAVTSAGARVWDLFLERSHLQERLALSPLKDSVVRDSVLRAAKALISRADRDSIDDTDFIERVVGLAYSVGPYRTLLTTLDEIAAKDTVPASTIIELFERASIVEIYTLGQVARGRVEAITQLRQLISDPETLEDKLQVLVEGAPWIIHPDWTPLSRNQPLAQTRKNFESWYQKIHGEEIITSPIQYPRREPDFVMLNHRGYIEIVEIKRSNHDLTDPEFERAMRYLSAVEEYINNNSEVRDDFDGGKLTLVCDGISRLSYAHASLIESDRRIIHMTWQDVLEATTRTHGQFLEKVEETQGRLPPLVPSEE